MAIFAQAAVATPPGRGNSPDTSAAVSVAGRSQRLPEVEMGAAPRVLTNLPAQSLSAPSAVVQASATAPISHRRKRAQAEPIPPGTEEPLVGMTLDQVTQVAMFNSPAIREAQQNVVAAQGRAFQASRYPNPTFGHASPQLAGNQSQYNAYVIQDFVTKGKIRLDTAAAERQAREAELMLVRARFDVLTMVRQRFYTALAMQRRAEILESMVQIARTSHDVSERLWKADIGTRGDVLLLQIELSKAEAELKNANFLSETSRRQLSAATGLFDLNITRVVGNLAEKLPDYEVIAVQQGVLERNALVGRAQVAVARSQFVLRRAEVEPFPNFNMMGGIQNQQPGAFAPLTQGIYQIQMVVPLWNRNRGNIRAAEAEIGASMAGLGRVRNELANNTADAMGRYLTATQITERYENEILPNANELQKISSRLYQEGQIEFLKYLASQRALLDANLAYIDAQAVRWVAAAEIAGLLQNVQFP
ncbi:MAG TPA: TolC family protein [Pirellulales bacterium]|nr:TolC family protein [Pirellulales bacterium]